MATEETDALQDRPVEQPVPVGFSIRTTPESHNGRAPGSRLDELRAGGLMREEALRSVINSEAIEGVDVPFDLAARLLDEVLQEPLPDIG